MGGCLRPIAQQVRRFSSKVPRDRIPRSLMKRYEGSTVLDWGLVRQSGPLKRYLSLLLSFKMAIADGYTMCSRELGSL